MADYAARCAVLERENETLRDRIVWLEQKIGLDFEAPLELRLTSHESRLLGVLKKAPGAVSKEGLMNIVYHERVTDGEVPEVKIVDVFVCKLRKKLKPLGIEIVTHWGRGYSLSRAGKDRLAAIIEGKAA